MPNYPESLDDDISLFLAVNNARTRLTSSISISDLTIPVVTTSGFPNQGFVTILTNPDDITEAEAISYVGLTETTFSGTQRGAGGTPIFAHGVGNNVDLTVMAEHHNELKDAVIELEKIVGISGSHHFVPKDAQGNVIISGTLGVQGDVTLENLVEAGWITASGSAVICGPGFFKGDLDVAMDLVVSGVATFGVIPVAVEPAVQYITDDSVLQITSTAFVDTGVETAPLPAGHNLVFWSASAGGGSIGSGGSVNLRARFAGVTQGDAEDVYLNNNNPWGGINLGGFKMITGDGVNTVKLQADLDTSSSSIKISAQSILSIPFGDMGLVEGTDYWFANGSDSDTNVGTTNVVITTLNATLPDAGDYIIFGSMEGEHQFDFRASYWANGAQISTTQERSLQSGDRRNFPFQLLFNLPSGANVFEAKASRFTTSNARFRRGRLCVVRAASFDNVVGFRQNDNQATSSSTYAKVTPSEINYTAAQNETIVVFGNPVAFVSTVTGPPMVAYKLVDETAAVDLVTDVSTARFRETDDRIPAFLFSKLDDVFGPKTFSLSIREPEATGSSVEHETVNMLVWSMTLAGFSTPDTPVTTIDGNTITTHEITAEIITTDFLTASDVTVTGTLNASSAVTTLGDTTARWLTVTGTSDLGATDIDWLTVTGTSDLCGDVDVKGNLTVSGTAKFGQDNTPPAANGDVIFASQDTEQTTASLTFVDANCETAPLLNGVEYLIIYAGNFGIDSESISVESQTLLGSTRIGRSGFAASALGTFGNNANNASYCHGIYRATGNGTDTVKFQFRVMSGTQTAYADAMSIICIPLDSYAQGTDYFWVETTNSDSAVVTNAAVIDPPTTSMLSTTFTSMDAGDWLFICSAEGNVSAGATRGAVINFQVASTDIGTSRYTFQGRSFGTLTWNSVAVANMVNVAGGNTLVDIFVASTQAAFADFYRGRIFAIKRSLFTQILSSTDTTGAATSSSSFVDFTPLDTTIVPTQPNSPIIVLTTAPSYTQQNDSGFVSAIRNETDATDYRADSGGREAERGGIGSADINLANSFMAHFEERTASTEYRYQYRSVGVGPVAVGRNEDDNGGEHSEMIVWEFLASVSPFVPITQTCIDDDSIQTGTLVGDTIQARLSLTISGVPVATGTGGGGAVGDFVQRAGDSMTGNLDMQGNNVYNAGVVAMQDGTPVLTTSGLLWFDTDATGHGDHGSASLPGGMLAATLTSSSGISVPDAVFQPNIPWDTVDIDNGGWYDAAFPQRLTVPSGILYAQVYANVNFDAENSTNRRQIRIYRNGNTSDNVAEDNQRSISNATFYPTLRAESAVITVSAGDYFQLSSDLNTNGGSLDILASGTNFGILAIDTRGIPGVNSVNLLQGDINVVAGSGIQVVANSQTGQIEVALAEETRELQLWTPDAPPASGTSFNSEWGDGFTLAEQNWTEWDEPAALTVSTLPRAGALRLKHTATTAGVSGLIKTAPTSNFTIFTKLFMMTNTSEDFREFGVVLSDDLLGNPSTANFAVVSVPFHEDGTDPQAYYFGFATQHFTDYNSFDRNLSFSAVHFPANEPIYVKVHVDVTTRIVSTAASRDGLIWGQEIVSDFSGDLTSITEMGYWIGNNTTAGPLTITSDFFRVVENIDHSAPLHGNFLTVSGVPQAIVVATGTQGGGGSGDGTITDINAQAGPSVTVTGVGPIQVITTDNLLTITGTDGLGISDINEQFGPSVSITGTAGIGVTTVGNVITIDGTEVQGAGGDGSTISGCYTHVQSSASDTWNVAHNLASVPVNYIVLDNSNVEVIPDTFTVNDGDSVTITFAFPQAGTADIFPCISGTGSPIGETEGTATVSGCYSHVQTVATGTWTVDHGLATEMVNYILLDDTGSQFQPDDFTVVDPNQVTFDFVSNRTGIANIFACTSGTVTFQGGHFSNIVAVTGTFTEGITVGSGTTYITGEGIDTPELKIAGETPNFGAEFSGYYLNPLAKPSIVHPKSDWFDDNSGNPTLTGSHPIDAGTWTLWDEDGVAHANNGKTDHMRDGGAPYTEYDTNNMLVIHDGSTIGGWLGYFQAAPAYDFTITARVSIKRSIFDGSAGGEENTMGIFIAEDLAAAPSTANLVAMSLHWDGLAPTSANWAIAEASEWSDFDTRSTGSEVNIGIQEYLWVRLWYRPSTDDRVYFVHSHDGITWSELRRTTPIGFTVGSIGFGLNSNKTFTSTGKIDFFAVASGVTSDRAAGHGRLIPLPV